MDARVPAVVAVLVTRDPGPWFDEALAALAAQDYEELSVLVLVAGGTEDPRARVAAVLPDAFVRRLDEERSFGAAANVALGMVEGAAFFLLCHDDCAPDPDALHILVEESFRSNAGMVTPKMVHWADPSVLLHVGMSADKTGAVVERVQANEVDHGQHDAVRDVFVAPGGFTLIRADLFRELGGFDPAIVAMGEDLDLSWRAQVAGGRVVVAPDARVRHLEAVAGGLRPVAPQPDGSDPPSLQALQRRHELRAVLTCYSAFHLLRVLPQDALLAAGEWVVAVCVRDRARARALTGAWRWNLGHPGELRLRRKAVKAQRTFPDSEVRRLQTRGSARLSTYFSRLSHQGFDVAHGRTPSLVESAAGDELEGGDEPLLTGSVGLAFSEDADFDDLDDLGHRSGRDRFGRRRRRQAFFAARSRLVVWLVVVAVLLFGSRDLFAAKLPLVGQFLPMLDWGATWHHLVAGWQPAGVGTTAPATPAFGVLGVLGTALFGGMGLLEKVLVLGCIPLGAWGVARLLRPLCSPRARLVGAVCYLGLPLAYNALAQGRWDGLVAYAAVPWIFARLARATRLPPFSPRPGAPDEPPAPPWRATLAGEMLALGVIEAVAVAFAPAVAPVVLLCALGIVVGSYVVGQSDGALRALGVAAGATLVAAVLSFPWVIGTLAAGHGAMSVFGLAGSAANQPEWNTLVRFAVGPTGSTPLSWLLIAAALLPLLIGRQARLAWAGRLWTVACMAWILALAVTRGWTGSFTPSITVVLAPAALAVACGVGLGVSAFETDLSGYHFGWRQVVTLVAVVAALIGLFPVVAEAGNGHWGLPSTGYEEPLSFMAPQSAQGAFRVLWLGDPRALPIGAWPIQPGLAYATSENGTPDATDLWAPAGAGPASTLAGAIDLARAGGTANLGQLLAPAGVRYVVVAQSLSPGLSGSAPGTAFPAPPGLLAALVGQDDLEAVPGGGQGFAVFENTQFLPERAQRSAGAVPAGAVAPVAADLSGWHPVLPGPRGASSYQGPLGVGSTLASYAPAGGWHLSVAGRPVAGRPAFGWAAQYPATPAGTAALTFSSSPVAALGTAVMLVLWVVVAALLLGRRRWLDWWWQPLRRRRRTRHAGVAHDGQDPPGPGPGDEDPARGVTLGTGVGAGENP